MKSLKLEIIKLSVFLSLTLLFGQTVSSQVSECRQISLNKIFTKLNSPETKALEYVNRKLISEIRENKVDFTLTEADQKKLKNAGASELLIETIRQNPAEVSKEASLIYKKYVDHFESKNIEQIKIALEAAKEFVKKFENDGCYAEQIKYFKDAILILEQVLPHPHPPRDPKIDLKFRILKELTDKYKAKNYVEVFALGKKVYELDSDFIPLFTILASLGYDQAKLYGNKSRYNVETVFYAEHAIKLLETSKKDFPSYGEFEYKYKTKAEAFKRMKEILDYMKRQNLYKANSEVIK